MRKYIICLALVLMTMSVLMAQGPKLIFQEVYDVDGSIDNPIHPEEGTIEFRFWITARPDYYIDGPNQGLDVHAYMEGSRFVLSFNISNLMAVGAPRDWLPGEIVRIEVVHTPTGNVANVEFPLAAGNSGQFRYGSNGLAITLGPPPGMLFNSRPPNLDPIYTTASLVDDYPNEGVYRAIDWEVEDYWYISFSTIRVLEDLVVNANLRREFDLDELIGGPSRFRTEYSIDAGETWIQHPEMNHHLPNSDNWYSISYELPEECYNLEEVMVRWRLYDAQGIDLMGNGWGEIADVTVTAEVAELERPIAATNAVPEDEADNVEITTAIGWTYESESEYSDPDGYVIKLWVDSPQGEPEQAMVEGGAGEYLFEDHPFDFLYGTTYYWQVIPYNEAGDALNTPIWSFTTEYLLLPPQDLIAINQDTSVLLQWNAPEYPVLTSDQGTEQSNKSDLVNVRQELIGFHVYRNDTLLNTQPTDDTSYTDTEVVSGETYEYYVTARYFEGVSPASNVVEINYVSVENELEIPLVTALSRNYPNPFNPETTISFALAEDGDVKIEIYNSRGQRVKTLVNENMKAGHHRIIWNGKDSANREVSSGMYFYRMQKGSYTSTKKMILMK